MFIERQAEREKVTFPQNIPTQVTLAGSGQPQGTDWRYFLSEDRIMWVKPAVHNQIVGLGAAEGDTITITQVKTSQAPATWTVELDIPQPAATRNLRRAVTAPPSRPAEPLSALERRAARQPQPAATMAQQLPAEEGPTEGYEGMLYTALTAAITATLAAESHAARYGSEIRFERADVVKFATTIYISMNAGSNR